MENDKRGIKNCKSYGKVNFLVYRGKKDEKYYEKYGFGDINDNLYKVRNVETSVNEFENYEDIDLKSYIDYTQNYIEKYFE